MTNQVTVTAFNCAVLQPRAGPLSPGRERPSKSQNKMCPEVCLGVGESYCSEGGVGSEMLPRIDLLVLLASTLGLGKMSKELKK